MNGTNVGAFTVEKLTATAGCGVCEVDGFG